MNRFRSRKKSQGDGGDGSRQASRQPSRRPSVEADVPSLPSFSSRTFGRKKKQPEPEPQPELDLSSALPDTNNFRTSLLMPNLSARFSMLREADDPTSKIGKANDDSVLFPKRASRLDLFNSRQQGLSDIAEVDSLRGSIRPPFASTRTESYTSDGYGTDGEGSVMSRSRPGEGNTMFGGRQKIFKIPVGQSGSVKNFGSTDEGELPAGGNMGGKALYESDTLPSAFQIMREQQRQEREKAANDHFNMPRSSEEERSGSPPLARYNRNRETSSSTNSGPSQPRTSTAATSIASQKSIYGEPHGFGHGPPSGSQPNSASSDRPFQKAKKLYGQGLDSHQYDSQSSSLQRINSLNRNRGGGLPRNNLAPSRSASNLNDKYRQGYLPGGPLYASNGFRAGSPPPSNTPPRMQEFDLGLNNDVSPITSPLDSGYGNSPQLVSSKVSPPMSPHVDSSNPDATLVAALEPNDLGKATASGAFNKPKKQYDEQQYLQRQLQLQEGRNTPSPGPMARPFSPQGLILNDTAFGRSRNNSQASALSRSNSIMHPWEHQMEDRKMRTVPEQRGRSPSMRREFDEPSNPTMENSFFGGFSGSEMGSAQESESEADPNSPIPSKSGSQGFRQPAPPPVSETKPVEVNRALNFNPSPSHLGEPQEEAASDSRSYRSETTVTPHHEKENPAIDPTITMDPDSPTLGPVGVSNDLSGMVRQHLRNASGTSSVYPEDSPRRSRSSRPEVRESIFGHESALDQQEWNDEISHDDHWVKRASQKRESEVIPPLPQPLHFAARQMLEQATALKNQDSGKLKQMMGNDKAQRVLGGEAPRSSHASNDSGPSWQDQLRSHHARGPSTETQMEAESLAETMEAKKRNIINNLQSIEQGESRDASPAPSAGRRTHESSPARPAHPFSILKKTSKGALSGGNGKQEKPSKAMKMLGIDPNSTATADQPPPDLFMGREQLPDRAMPPMQKNGFKQRPQDVRQISDDSPTKRQRALFGSRSRQIPDRPSPSSSKSGSAYSDSSDRRPNSRKGSAGKLSSERSRADAFEQNGAGLAGVESRIEHKTPMMPPPDIPASIPMPRERSQSALSARIGLRSRSNSKGAPPPPASFEQRQAPPGTPHMINPSSSNSNSGNHPSIRPAGPYTSHSTPSVHNNDIHPAYATAAHPTMINPLPPSSPKTQNSFSKFTTSNNNRNRSINKNDISEPTFLSCTSSVDTVSLPPGASLSNGMDPRPTEPLSPSAPPIPQRDSRRKRTQTLLAALSGRNPPQEVRSALPSPTKTGPMAREVEDPYEERSTFSDPDDDDGPGNPKVSGGGRKWSYDRGRLRKTSSEGGNMNQRAKLQALEERIPDLPNGASLGFPPTRDGMPGEHPPLAEGQHVAYQAQRDVPASAVMF